MSEISLAVLISGNGSNLQAIIDEIESGKLEASIKLVISNNSSAFGLQRAQKHGITNIFIDHKDFNEREAFDQKIIEKIEEYNVDLIILAGFMRILSSKFVNTFKNKIINIHPSLLPKYPGLNTHRQVIENKDKEHGVTVHLVDEGLDSGQIIGYMSCAVEKNDTEVSIEKKIHKLEHYLYPAIIRDIQKGKILLKNNKILHDRIVIKNGKKYFN